MSLVTDVVISQVRFTFLIKKQEAMLTGFLFKISSHFLKNLEYLSICQFHFSMDQAHRQKQ